MSANIMRDVLAACLCAGSWLGVRISVGAPCRPRRLREALLLPAVAAVMLDGGLALWGWVLALLPTARPLLASLMVAAGCSVLALVDGVKRTMLREPVVYADRAEVLEVLRHPGLYLPFAGTRRVVLATALLLATVAALLWFEPPWPLSTGARAAGFGVFAALSLALSTLPATRVCAYVFAGWQPCLDPAADMRRFGMLATFVVHATLARAGRPLLRAQHRPADTGRQAAALGRPIVLVQIESFFDVGRLTYGVHREVLPHYTAVRSSSVQYGRLQVPCWGANTVRTEFAVLTGIDPGSIGGDRFNPYDRLARAPIASIAWRLRAAGYHTVCIHPFDTRFYGRRSVLPQLGFDRIIGPEAFERPSAGKYVPDEAVAACVRAVLDGAAGPCFVFVITMQTHGPWRAPGGAFRTHFAQSACGSLSDYLHVLHATDAALPAMCEAVAAHDGVLALYGDHQPSLPQSQTSLDPADQATDHLIWDPRRGSVGGGCRRDIRAEQLAAALCDVASDCDERIVLS